MGIKVYARESLKKNGKGKKVKATKKVAEESKGGLDAWGTKRGTYHAKVNRFIRTRGPVTMKAIKAHMAEITGKPQSYYNHINDNLIRGGFVEEIEVEGERGVAYVAVDDEDREESRNNKKKNGKK